MGSDVVSVENVPIKLSPTAFTLLKALLQQQGKVMPRERLLDAVWGEDAPESNALKVHLHNLRKSLVQANASIEVKAVAGTGFCVTFKPEQSSSEQSTSAEPKSTNKGNDQW